MVTGWVIGNMTTCRMVGFQWAAVRAGICRRLTTLMNKHVQIHVLENIRDHDGWTWGWEPGPNIIGNVQALDRFEKGKFTREEYFRCVVMLSESGKIVTGHDPEAGTEYLPRCLTVAGLHYLREIKHPVREWCKRNWFPMVVAGVTSLTTLGATVVNVLGGIGG